MYGYVYKTVNLVNGKIYIGQHQANMFEPDIYKGSAKMLSRAINKYGIDNFVCEIIEICDDKKTLNEKEKYYINFYKAQDRNIGYNIAPGGYGGDIISNLTNEEQSIRGAKISSALSGKKRSEEAVNNMRNGLLKYYQNPENKAIRKQINK